MSVSATHLDLTAPEPAARSLPMRPAGAATLPPGTLTLITGAFWLYATLSALLYAWGLSVSFASYTNETLFASWKVRVLQYVLLFAPLLGCYWLSLRRGWQPLLPRLLFQVGMAAGFAALAYPALVVIDLLLEMGGEWQTHPGETWFDRIDKAHFTTWLAIFTDFLVRYGFGLALVTGIATYKRFRDMESCAAVMERQCSEVRLAALRMQLSPHTLFNLLHTIRGHIGWDPVAAQEMVVQLADLLRRLLDAGAREFTGLADELQFVTLYLDLQRRRFADRLSISLPDPSTLPAAWVPSLILQPLVENAVVHGLAGHSGAVRVKVFAGIEDGQLRLRVINDMASGASRANDGIGLNNVRERLAVLFGPEARLQAGPGGPAEWIAEVRIPLLTRPPGAGADSSTADGAQCCA